MKIKILIEGKYTISAVMNGDSCPVENALTDGVPKYKGQSDGLVDMISRISEDGFDKFSSKQCHYIDNDHKIYELIRGKLRLIFFHGKDKNIVVCNEVIVKNSQKSDPKVVKRAKNARDSYYNSIKKNTLIEVRDYEDE